MLFDNQQTYRFQINKLFEKLRDRRQLLTVKYLNTPFLIVAFNAIKFSRLLANAIHQKKYQLQPATQHLTTIKNKKRILYRFNFVDKIVISAITHQLNQLAESFLSPTLHSYRKNSGTIAASIALAKYLSQNFQKTELNQKPPGVYLFKTDISDYTDNIPLVENSELWKTVDQLLNHHHLVLNNYEKELLKTCIRPSYRNLNGHLQSNTIGVPTGMAITPFLYNIYMHTIDEKISKIPNLFYLRYCDDIIMLHPNREQLIAAVNQTKTLLNQLALQCNPKKDQSVYLHPGCIAALSDSPWQPANYFEHLGFRFNLKGTYTLSKRRQHGLLLKLHHRIHNICQIIKNSPSDEKAQRCCNMLNTLFTDKNEQLIEIKNLLTQTTDIDALRHMDNLIALYLAEAVTGICGIRALRKISYQQLHRQYRLFSLVKLHQRYCQDHQPDNKK